MNLVRKRFVFYGVSQSHKSIILLRKRESSMWSSFYDSKCGKLVSHLDIATQSANERN